MTCIPFIVFDIDKIDKTAAIISILMGIITVLILIYLTPEGAFLIIILWLFVPAFIKKIVDLFKRVL